MDHPSVRNPGDSPDITAPWANLKGRKHARGMELGVVIGALEAIIMAGLASPNATLAWR